MGIPVVGGSYGSGTKLVRDVGVTPYDPTHPDTQTETSHPSGARTSRVSASNFLIMHSLVKWPKHNSEVADLHRFRRVQSFRCKNIQQEARLT